MDTSRASYRVRQCSKCLRDMEYHCVSCPSDLCSQCKENHMTILKTIDHKVLLYRERLKRISNNEICIKHSKKIYRKFCEICDVPACNNCQRHRKHKKIKITKAYFAKRQNGRETINTIRSDTLLFRLVLLTEIKADFKTFLQELSSHQSKLIVKANRLKKSIDLVSRDFDCKHSCLKQTKYVSRLLTNLCLFEHTYELSGIKPVRFLISKTQVCKIHDIPHLPQHTNHVFMTPSMTKNDVEAIESLLKIRIEEKEIKRKVKKRMLKLMTSPELHQSFTVEGVVRCCHMACDTSDRVWVTDRKQFILTNTTGSTLNTLTDLGGIFLNSPFVISTQQQKCASFGYGLHSVNSESKMIYIDWIGHINMLSQDIKTSTLFVKRTDFNWVIRCLHWSPLTGDILVGMCHSKITGKVVRYNQAGQLTQTIEQNNDGCHIYIDPHYITENNNGDVVVADFDYELCDLVVADGGGNYRFSYIGPPFGPRIEPHGVCTDALSHILVCDSGTNTVQIIDRDGKFLSHLLIRPAGIFKPVSLSYDVNTHRLWVGSCYNNKVCVYRYITSDDVLTGKNIIR